GGRKTWRRNALLREDSAGDRKEVDAGRRTEAAGTLDRRFAAEGVYPDLLILLRISSRRSVLRRASPLVTMRDELSGRHHSRRPGGSRTGGRSRRTRFRSTANRCRILRHRPDR